MLHFLCLIRGCNTYINTLQWFPKFKWIWVHSLFQRIPTTSYPWQKQRVVTHDTSEAAEGYRESLRQLLLVWRPGPNYCVGCIMNTTHNCTICHTTSQYIYSTVHFSGIFAVFSTYLPLTSGLWCVGPFLFIFLAHLLLRMFCAL